EAALGAQAEVLERYVFGGGLDAALEIVLGLERGYLRADQAEHDLLTLGDEPQGLEAAGAVRVGLEGGHVEGQPREDGLRHGIVAAARHPGALEVAPARVDGNRD